MCYDDAVSTYLDTYLMMYIGHIAAHSIVDL
jgi:hypothetical protein